MGNVHSNTVRVCDQAFNQLLLLKPTNRSEQTWRGLIYERDVNEAAEDVFSIQVRDRALPLDEIVALVRTARGVNVQQHHHQLQQQQQQQQQQRQQPHSPPENDYGESSLTTHSGLREQESVWVRLRGCLFPWNAPRVVENVPRANDAPGEANHRHNPQGHGNSTRLVEQQRPASEAGGDSVSTMGLPISKETQNNPQEMSQSDGYRSE